MKVNPTVVVVSVMLALLSNSCVVYYPQTVDIPLIHEKRDFRFDGGLSLAPPALNATLSYGLTDQLAVQVYGNTRPEESYHWQGALGYYRNLSAHKVVEIYAGAGTGRGYSPKPSTGGSLYNDYTLAFAQFNLGRLTTEDSRWEYGVGLKIGSLWSHLDKTDLITRTYDKRHNLLLEPTVFARPGGENVKVSFKLSGSWISNNTGRSYFPYSKINFGVALNIRP